MTISTTDAPPFASGSTVSWDGKPVAAVVGHGAAVATVRYHPDGKRAASADENGLVMTWDADSGKVVLEWS